MTDPRILILDDSTSAIDSETEDRIQQAIEMAGSDRTMFLITHRLSQIRRADLIIVMRKGRVAAVGSHEQLMQDSQPYRNIFARYEGASIEQGRLQGSHVETEISAKEGDDGQQ